MNILPIEPSTDNKQLSTVDLIFGGGAQDREQSIVMNDLKGEKGDLIKKKIDENIPALFVCGSPQLMGKYYEPGEGQRIEGLGIFDMVSKHPGPDKPRLIGNVIAEVQWENFTSSHPEQSEALPAGRQGSKGSSPKAQNDRIIVGFENHGGRTYLGPNAKPFAKVTKGNGNNGEDGTEGVIYKNAIGCYFHGPLLPKNPEIADFLIQRGLETKYNEEATLKPLDDLLEYKAKEVIEKKLLS